MYVFATRDAKGASKAKRGMAEMQRFFFVFLALTSMAAAGAVLTGARAVQDVVVHQANRTFAPAQLKVVRGANIRFVNDETIVHHAYVDTPGFSTDSGDIQPGGSAVLRFDKEGRFLVRCAIHPKMRLDVDVMPN